MFILIFTLAFAIFVAEAELDIIVPSFPEIQATFGLSVFETELVLTLNLLSHCIMALFAGTIGDKYGKKKSIIIGTLVFLLGSVVAIFAPTYLFLLVGRILQGGGAAFPMVLGFIVAFKNTPKESHLKVMGILSGIATVSVSIAPTIGSYITFYFGYTGNLIFIAILGVFSLLACMKYIPLDTEKDNNKKISLMEYKVVFTNKTAMLYIFTLGFVLSCYYTFIGLAPIYYMNDLGVSLKQFGLYQGFVTIVFGALSFFSGNIVNLLGKRGSSFMSITLWAIFVVLMVIALIDGVKSPMFITFAVLFSAIACVVPYNTLYALATQCIPGHEGKVSAMITTVRWLLSSISIQIAGFYYNNTFNSTIIMMLITLFSSFIAFYFLYNRDKNIRKEFV